MTQMMLFDAPAAPLFSAPVATTPVLDSSPVLDSCEESQSESTAKRSDDGLHHMGDLARLVLLRYELMAKRRARRAQRA